MICERHIAVPANGVRIRFRERNSVDSHVLQGDRNNQLLRIEEQLGDSGQYAGMKAFYNINR